MRIPRPWSKSSKSRRSHRAGVELTQTLSVASQMALLYPPGIDEWMRRELGCEASDGLRRVGRPR
jgi:hypothetical protein